MYKVLGRYEPAAFNGLQIGKHLYDFAVRLGLQRIPRTQYSAPEDAWEPGGSNEGLRVNVRGPEEQPHTESEVREWHRDGHRGLYNLPMSIVLWSSETPTELLMPNGSIVQPAPFEIVLIDNLQVKHRTPAEIGNNRWFFRWAVETPEEWSSTRTGS